MLELKHLNKTYKTKGGNITKALDDISVDFPEKGLVFLLGKSGSGKSTLLNMAGGLDKPDSGEIIVKGKSSKDFSTSDFDSYRNTYIGFIFQEYNVLDEFNVEQNISLALQLQGKKADKNKINSLLEQVDLKGFNKRKPNTLSGGQKQRIAIARALVKDPEIIMADEPTGALDSTTGKQIFDTLKKLSQEKLVIVVSHDRDFAEIYADRIIELKDGKIIEDITKDHTIKKSVSENIDSISDGLISIKDFSKVSEDDFKKIYEMLKGQNKKVLISSDDKDIDNIKKVCKINDEDGQEYFRKTEDEDIVLNNYDPKNTRFIKSRIPSSRAWKMGASSLGVKKVRLFFTILLSTAAFGMFGIVSTMMFYNGNYTIAEAFKNDGSLSAWKLSKEYRYLGKYHTYNEQTGEVIDYTDTDYSYNTTAFDDDDLDELNDNNVGLTFYGIYSFNDSTSINLANNLNNYNNLVTTYYNYSTVSQFIEYDEDTINSSNDFKLVGSYPTSENEITLSHYQYELFKEYNYLPYVPDSDDKQTEISISSPSDLIGKYINYSYSTYNENYETYTQNDKLKIVGVYTKDELNSKFDFLKQKDTSSMSSEDLFDLKSSFSDAMNNSFATVSIVNSDFIKKYNKKLMIKTNNDNNYIDGVYKYADYDEPYIYCYPNSSKSIDQIWQNSFYTSDVLKSNKNKFNVYNLDGTITSSPDFTDNKVYLGKDYLENLANQLNNSSYQQFKNTSGEIVPTRSENNYLVLVNNLKAEKTYYETYDKYLNEKQEDEDSQKDKENKEVNINLESYYFDESGNRYTSEELFEKYEYVTRPSVFFNKKGTEYSSVQDEKQEVYTDRYTYYYVDPLNPENFVSPIVYNDKPSNYANYISTDLMYINKKDGTVSLTKKDNSFLASYYGLNKTTKEYEPVYIANEDFDQYSKYYVDSANKFIKTNSCKYLFGQSSYETFFPEIKKLANKLSATSSFDIDFTSDDMKTLVDAIKDDLYFDIYQNGEYQEIKFEFKNLTLTNADKKTLSCPVNGFFMFNDYELQGSLSTIMIDGDTLDEFAVVPDYGYENNYDWSSEEITDYKSSGNEKYQYVISSTDNSKEQTYFVLQKWDDGLYKYSFNNTIYTTVTTFISMLSFMTNIFLIAGAVLGVFSALMLLNYITASISAKKKEIGILRAIGARGSDVFKIFFAESFIITAICVILAIIGSYFACYYINISVMETVSNVKLLDFGIINALEISGVAAIIALIGTFLPVLIESKKPPVAAIRSL